jgi:hypothetical protein
MPPRHAFWTIIYGNQPTSFRAATKEELLPTFRQLQSRHSDAVMMWFARGRLWKSPEEAREALGHRRTRPSYRDEHRRSPGATHGSSDRPTPPRPSNRPTGPRAGVRPAGPRRTEWRDSRGTSREGQPREDRRGRDWRPGGTHSDPRDRFKVPRDVKRQRFAARVRRNAQSSKPPRKKKDDDE